MKYLAALLLTLLCATGARAEIVEKSGVMADLPEGWIMSDSQSGNNILGSANVIIYAPERDGQLIVSIFNINETGAESLAEGTSERLKGTKPEPVDGGYLFSFSVNGTDKEGQPFTVNGKTFVGGKGKMLGTVTYAGENPKLKDVLHSLQGSTPEVQEVLQGLRPGFKHLVAE